MTQNKLFRGTARSKIRNDWVTYYGYHKTVVVEDRSTTDDPCVIIRTGGYMTATTKRAINQALNESGIPFLVVQRNFEWFVQIYDHLSCGKLTAGAINQQNHGKKHDHFGRILKKELEFYDGIKIQIEFPHIHASLFV
jgi:hypothetical protein